MRSSLDKIIELEHEEMWKDKRKPEIDENLYNSHIHMDIWTVSNADLISYKNMAQCGKHFHSAGSI